MSKPLALIIVVFLFVSCKRDIVPSRTAYFPKAAVQPQDIPDKENLWVFILAGQSNMAGRGIVEPRDTIPSDRILSINKAGELIIAKEPLHFYEPKLTGLDLGMSFGREMIKQLPDSISILLIPTAVGGSSMTQWLEDQEFRDVQLFSNFEEKAALGKQYGTIKGILWHQGESDAGTEETIGRYEQRLSQLVRRFRKVSGNDRLPVIFGELGSFSKNREQWKQINEKIRSYAQNDSFTGVVKTGDLKDKGDKVHFDSKSLRTMGKRYAREYLKIYRQSHDR